MHKAEVFAIVGPESTGKTSLCLQLSNHFNGVIVPEFSREYLNSKNGHYSQSDLLHIAKEQLLSEQEATSTTQRPIFCDTDILVVMIWYRFRFGEDDLEIIQLFQKQAPRKYLLTYPDLAWQPDPLRENEHELMQLFDLYEAELKKLNLDYQVIRGTGDQRFKNALKAVDLL